MIALALIALSIAVFACRDIPVFGGRLIRGRKARAISGTVVIILTLSFALPGQLQFLIDCSVVAFGVCIYFFGKTWGLTDSNNDCGVPGALDEDKKLYRDVLRSMAIGLSVMALLTGCLYVLILAIR